MGGILMGGVGVMRLVFKVGVAGLAPTLVSLLVAIIASARSASGESFDEDNLYRHPGNRYTYEDASNGIPAHWEGKIQAQFIGLTEIEVQKAALLNFMMLSHAGGYESNIIGFPNEIYTGESAAEGSNFIIVELTAEEFELASHGDPGPTFKRLMSGSSIAAMHRIGEEGITAVASGCGARWSVSQENRIDAFAISIASEISEDEKVDCINELMPRAFGVFPFVTDFNVSVINKDSGEKQEIVLHDQSETILQILASRVCREQAGILDSSCPFSVISEVLKYHGDIAKKFGKD